jgi:hypothetical protein
MLNRRMTETSQRLQLRIDRVKRGGGVSSRQGFG